jgi:hypothetical protein
LLSRSPETPRRLQAPFRCVPQLSLRVTCRERERRGKLSARMNDQANTAAPQTKPAPKPTPKQRIKQLTEQLRANRINEDAKSPEWRAVEGVLEVLTELLAGEPDPKPETTEKAPESGSTPTGAQ